MPYRDRAEAGQILAGLLGGYANRDDVLVLALPRGGVPVGYEIARALHAPLDVFLVRKLGVPGHEELGMGALATGGVRVLNEVVLRSMDIPPDVVEAVTARAQGELVRRERLYRDGRPAPDVRGRIVVLVDDGLATGSTMRAAIAAMRRLGPQRIVAAVPVAAAATCEELTAEVDEMVCASTPEYFYSVGAWYQDFEQTTDEEVHDLLVKASQGKYSAGTA